MPAVTVDDWTVLPRTVAARPDAEDRAPISVTTAPRGYDPVHPRAEWLKRKSLTVGFPPLPKELLVSRELIGWLVRNTKQVAPLIVWLADATMG